MKNQTLVLVTAVMASLSSFAATYSWNLNANGNWNAPANWNPNTGFPNAAGDVADLTKIPADGGRVVTLNVALTLGELRVGNGVGGGSITLQTGTAGSIFFDNGEQTPSIIRGGSGSVSYGDTLRFPIAFDGILHVANHGANQLYFSHPVTGGEFVILPENSGVVQFDAGNFYFGGTQIKSGTLLISSTAQSAATGAPLGTTSTVDMGDPDAVYAATLSLASRTGGSSLTLDNLVLRSSANENILRLQGNAQNPAQLVISDFARENGTTLTLHVNDAGNLGTNEKIMIPESSQAEVKNGILPPWITIDQAANSFFFATTNDNGVAAYKTGPTAFSPAVSNQVVTINGATLASDQTVFALKLTANTLNLNTKTLTIGDEDNDGAILFGNNAVISGGALDWPSGNLYAYVDSSDSIRSDQIRNATLRNLTLPSSGILTKSGYGRLFLDMPALPAGLTYRIQNGTLSHTSTEETLFDSSAVDISGAGIFELAGNRQIRFAQSDNMFNTLALYNNVTLTLDAGQRLATRRTLRVGNTSTLILTNGASYHNGTMHLRFGDNTRDNRLIIAGRDPATQAPSTFDLNGQSFFLSYSDAGYNSNNNKLIITDGGVMTNVNVFAIGESQGGLSGNELTLSGGGKLYSRWARLGTLCSNATSRVLDPGTLWDNGGGPLELAHSGGGAITRDNHLIIGNRAVVTNITEVRLCQDKNLASGNNSLRLHSGGELHSRGDAGIGYGFSAGGSSGNWMRLTDADTVWNMNRANLYIGRSEQGTISDSTLTIGNGANLLNAGAINMGYAHARDSWGNRLTITNGATLTSFQRVAIACGSYNSNRNGASYDNRVLIAGGLSGDSVWDLNGGALHIGLRHTNLAATSNQILAYDNTVTLAPGGVILNAGAVSVGTEWRETAIISSGDVTTDYNSRDNALRLCGGAFYGTTLTLHSNNRLDVVVGKTGVKPATFTGNVEFKEGTFIVADFEKDALPGSYPVLIADELITPENFAFIPSDTDRLRHDIIGNTIWVTYKLPRTLFILK